MTADLLVYLYCNNAIVKRLSLRDSPCSTHVPVRLYSVTGTWFDCLRFFGDTIMSAHIGDHWIARKIKFNVFEQTKKKASPERLAL